MDEHDCPASFPQLGTHVLAFPFQWNPDLINDDILQAETTSSHSYPFNDASQSRAQNPNLPVYLSNTAMTNNGNLRYPYVSSQPQTQNSYPFLMANDNPGDSHFNLQYLSQAQTLHHDTAALTNEHLRGPNFPPEPQVQTLHHDTAALTNEHLRSPNFPPEPQVQTPRYNTANQMSINDSELNGLLSFMSLAPRFPAILSHLYQLSQQGYRQHKVEVFRSDSDRVTHEGGLIREAWIIEYVRGQPEM